MEGRRSPRRRKAEGRLQLVGGARPWSQLLGGAPNGLEGGAWFATRRRLVGAPRTDLVRGSSASSGVEPDATLGSATLLGEPVCSRPGRVRGWAIPLRWYGAELPWRRGGGREPAGASPGRSGTPSSARDVARPSPGGAGAPRARWLLTVARRDESVAMARWQRPQRCAHGCRRVFLRRVPCTTGTGDPRGSTAKRREPQGRQRDATSPRRAGGESRRGGAKPRGRNETLGMAPGRRRRAVTPSGSGRQRGCRRRGEGRNPEEADGGAARRIVARRCRSGVLGSEERERPDIRAIG